VRTRTLQGVGGPYAWLVEKRKLKSGAVVAIRPIEPDDGERLAAAFARLSPDSRYRRFLSVKSRLSATETHYLIDAVDGRDHVALVATPARDPERILAVARFVRLPDDPDTAEFAIVVGDELQGQGLGTVLLQRLADEAVALGVRRFSALMLSDNVAAHRLVERLARRIPQWRRIGPAVDELEFELAA
jgi:RimJ/RimL family protein N-acetyltransferase